MKTKAKEPVIYDGPEVERCRQVRRQLEREFKTLDALFAETVRLDRLYRRQENARRRKAAKARSTRRSRS